MWPQVVSVGFRLDSLLAPAFYVLTGCPSLVGHTLGPSSHLSGGASSGAQRPAPPAGAMCSSLHAHKSASQLMFGVDLQQVLLLQAGHSVAGPASNRVGGEVRGPAPARSDSMPVEAGAVSGAVTGLLGTVPSSPLPLGRRSLVQPSSFVAMAQAVSAAKAALELAGERQQ